MPNPISDLKQSKAAYAGLLEEAQRAGGRDKLDPSAQQRLLAEEKFVLYDVTREEANDYAKIIVHEIPQVGTRHSLANELKIRLATLEYIMASRTMTREEANQLAILEDKGTKTSGAIPEMSIADQKQIVFLRALSSDRYARPDASIYADLWEERIRSATGRLVGKKEKLYFELAARTDTGKIMRIPEGRRRPVLPELALADFGDLRIGE